MNSKSSAADLSSLMASKHKSTKEIQSAVWGLGISRQRGTCFSDGSIQLVKGIRFWRIRKTRRSSSCEGQREESGWCRGSYHHSLRARSQVRPPNTCIAARSPKLVWDRAGISAVMKCRNRVPTSDIMITINARSLSYRLHKKAVQYSLLQHWYWLFHHVEERVAWRLGVKAQRITVYYNRVLTIDNKYHWYYQFNISQKTNHCPHPSHSR